jgi:UDP-glucose 4-epimerase
MPRRVLVTGGAGFVGSHVVLALLERGDAVAVLDDLRLGHRAAVAAGVELVVGQAGDRALLDGLLGDGNWDAVMHFAALSQVGESMADPMRYLDENVGAGLRLIRACVAHHVPRFVLSSTAALFGRPDALPIAEDAVVAPESPYGESKWALERALAWAGRLHGLRGACLRYFNAAGADPGGRLGEDHRPETHLVPLAIDAALGRRPPLQVFGDDYATPDGTAIRDYVHVTDLAQAHLLALDRLDAGSVTYNLGSEQGYSVRAVIAAVAEATGLRVPHAIAPRRQGDAAALVASSARIRKETGWTPRHSSLAEIVRTAASWRRAHPHGYGD